MQRIRFSTVGWLVGARCSFRTACLFLLVQLSLLPAIAAVQEVGPINLTVHDLDREIRFFTQVLAFEESSRARLGGAVVEALFGLPGAEVKTAELKLGAEHIVLAGHATKGRPIPPDSRSYDHWFQHIAIVVSDMDKAFQHLRQQRVKFVSTGPQTLPDWNPAAAGIKAFYFRDPEDHVLELIWFPPGKGDPKWHNQPGRLFLGIDHTAIVVSDTEDSLRFYRDSLGLRVAGESENYGVEQEHLNQVFGVRLRITALRAPKGPGIEFLEYLSPPGGRLLPEGAKPNDLTFWRTHLVAEDASRLARQLREAGVRFVSTPASQSQIFRDPDGHALQLDLAARTPD